MKLEQASRKKAKIKLALQGPSGSGKTMSALLLAYGLCGDWKSIAVIDTENRSSELYSHLGQYYVVQMSAPFTPKKYCDAIKLCEKSNIEVVIIDSVSHEWEGSGGILDIHSNMMGNSFTNWSKVTPRHNEFVQKILQSPCHIIGTIRSKQDYILAEKNGKQVPEKIGLKGVTREGMDYEFTLVLDIDIKHHATASKDRTQLFNEISQFKISSATGRKILEWCESGEVVADLDRLDTSENSMDQHIKNCKSMKSLIDLYGNCTKVQQDEFRTHFALRKDELTNASNSIAHINPAQQNGITTIITG